MASVRPEVRKADLPCDAAELKAGHVRDWRTWSLVWSRAAWKEAVVRIDDRACSPPRQA
jgi:hypothetical protein